MFCYESLKYFRNVYQGEMFNTGLQFNFSLIRCTNVSGTTAKYKCVEGLRPGSLEQLLPKMPKWNGIPEHVNDLPSLGEKIRKMIVIDGNV